MATCRMTNCGHTVRRSAESRMLGWSWNLYNICTCCANELVNLGEALEYSSQYFVVTFSRSSDTTQLLGDIQNICKEGK